MLKKIMMVIVMIGTMAACVGCGEEPKKEADDPNDGFVTINESFKEITFTENIETENIEWENVITENVITWENVERNEW